MRSQGTAAGLTARLSGAYTTRIMAGPQPPPITSEGRSRMTFDRVAIVESSLDTYLAGAAASPTRLGDDAPLRDGSGLTARKAVELF